YRNAEGGHGKSRQLCVLRRVAIHRCRKLPSAIREFCKRVPPHEYRTSREAPGAGSISAFGFMVPVLVDREGGIIAGHGRVLAARKLKLERAPVIVVDHLTETEKRAYAIADNKIALNAGWDEEMLRVELESLKNDGMHLDSLGFSEEEFNELLDKLKRDERPDEDATPQEPVNPVSRPGDIWQLGDHVLFCGDALENASYTAVLAGEAAHMTFTDPPYNGAYRSPGLGVGIANDNLGTALRRFWKRPAHKCCGTPVARCTSACLPQNCIRCKVHSPKRVDTGQPSPSGARTPSPWA